MEEMLERAPREIRKLLSNDLAPEELANTQALMNFVHRVYERLGLLDAMKGREEDDSVEGLATLWRRYEAEKQKESANGTVGRPELLNYHNHAHNLGVVFAMLTIARRSGSAQNKRDLKIAFLAALLHDFHIRNQLAPGKDARGNDVVVGKPARVAETLRQVRDLGGIRGDRLDPWVLTPENTAAPTEEKYRLLVNAEWKSEFRTLLQETFPGENLNSVFAEVEAMILRTDFASDVPLAPAETEVKGIAARIRNAAESLINKGVPLGQVIEETENRFEMLEQGKTEAEPKTWNENQFRWIQRQKGIELAYLKTLASLPRQRRRPVHRMAVQLEKGGDQAGFYWCCSAKMVEQDVNAGLHNEIPVVDVAGTYPFFYVPELLNPGVLDVLSELPSFAKENLVRNVGHMAQRSTDIGMALFDAMQRAGLKQGMEGLDAALVENGLPPWQVIGTFMNAAVDWEKERKPNVLSALNLKPPENPDLLFLFVERVIGSLGEETAGRVREAVHEVLESREFAGLRENPRFENVIALLDLAATQPANTAGNRRTRRLVDEALELLIDQSLPRGFLRSVMQQLGQKSRAAPIEHSS
jgi:hypothetical protein